MDTSMSKTTKTLLYKNAQFFGDDTTRTLQSMVQSALRKKKAAFERRQVVDGENSFRFVNYHGPYKGIKVGMLLDYTQDHAKLATEIDPTSETLPLTPLKPPGDGQFVDGLLYFGVSNNHVVLVQSASLRSQQLEDHINWLLRSTDQLTDEQFVALVDQPPPELTGQIAATKGLAFSAPVNFQTGKKRKNEEDRDETRIQVPEDRTQKLSIRPRGGAWAAIRNMLPPEMELPTELDVDQIVENRQLVVKLELSWKRARKDDSTTLLDTISNQLRHVDSELDYEIRTKSGLRISKDKLKLSQPVSVEVGNSGFLKKEELWPAMLEWLKELIENQRVLSEE